MWVCVRQGLECCHQYSEIRLEYRRAYGNLDLESERFGRFDLYFGWSNLVRASWVYERRITALLGR
jgi:hypothetical protein